MLKLPYTKLSGTDSKQLTITHNNDDCHEAKFHRINNQLKFHHFGLKHKIKGPDYKKYRNQSNN